VGGWGGGVPGGGGGLGLEKAIVCVGETLQGGGGSAKNRGATLAIHHPRNNGARFRPAVQAHTRRSWRPARIAYEPTNTTRGLWGDRQPGGGWGVGGGGGVVGTGRRTPGQAQEVHAVIRSLRSRTDLGLPSKTRIVYGRQRPPTTHTTHPPHTPNHNPPPPPHPPKNSFVSSKPPPTNKHTHHPKPTHPQQNKKNTTQQK